MARFWLGFCRAPTTQPEATQAMDCLTKAVDNQKLGSVSKEDGLDLSEDDTRAVELASEASSEPPENPSYSTVLVSSLLPW